MRYIDYRLLNSGNHSWLSTQRPTYKGTYAVAILQVVSSSNLPPQALDSKYKSPSSMKFSVITVLLAVAVSGGAAAPPEKSMFFL